MAVSSPIPCTGISRRHNSVFTGMFARFDWGMHLSTGDTTERVNGELVSGTYFPVLGIKPATGRLIAPSDDRVQGDHPVAVLSFDYWKTRFSGSPSIVNQKINLNGHPFTVIGIAQPGFSGIDVGVATQVFVPMMMKPQMTPGWNALDERRSRFARVFARLRPGVTAAQAEASLQPFFKAMRLDEMKDPSFGDLSEYDRREFQRASLKVTPTPNGHSRAAEDMSAPLWTLMAIVVGVLLITCANVAGLLVARGIARQREIAIRLALGGSRARVVQQLVIESLLLGAVGALGGLLVAAWGTSLLLGFFVDPDVAVAVSSSPDLRVVIFTLGGGGACRGRRSASCPAFQATQPSPRRNAEGASRQRCLRRFAAPAQGARRWTSRAVAPAPRGRGALRAKPSEPAETESRIRHRQPAHVHRRPVPQRLRRRQGSDTWRRRWSTASAQLPGVDARFPRRAMRC